MLSRCKRWRHLEDQGGYVDDRRRDFRGFHRQWRTISIGGDITAQGSMGIRISNLYGAAEVIVDGNVAVTGGELPTGLYCSENGTVTIGGAAHRINASCVWLRGVAKAACGT